MARGLFITGTDTGVGKTVITGALLRYLRRHGIDAVSMKPVQTGAAHHRGRWERPDLKVHWEAAQYEPTDQERDLMCPYIYEPAVSPHLAGMMSGHYPDIATIEKCAKTLLKMHDVLLVEGAGGVMVPLTRYKTMLDLMKRLGYPVLVVAHVGLGTINHSLLTLQALKDADIEVAGIVFNEPHFVEDAAIKVDNPWIVSELSDVPMLGQIGYELFEERSQLGAVYDVWHTIEMEFTGLNVLRQLLTK